MPIQPSVHHRRSIRLKGYDYTRPGAYFVTIVTVQRDGIFGRITGGRMDLSPLGQIVQEEWLRSAQIRKEIQLFEDEFVIMPNHLHAIVRIIEVGADGVRPGVHPVRPVQPVGMEGRAKVGADGVRPGVHPVRPVPPTASDTGIYPGAHAMRPYRVPRSLGSFIAGFKSSVTSRAERELHMAGIWQRNYYEHIIRTESEFNKIWDYMDANPLRWQEDQLNPFPASLDW